MVTRTKAILLTLATAGLLATSLTTAPAPTASAAVRKHVNTDYTLLRRSPHSYVIGTAYRDWTADVHGDQQEGYRWARVFGTINTCLWIYAGAVEGDGAADVSCGDPAQMSTDQFTNGQIGGSATDGASVATEAGAGCATYDGTHLTGYGNVSPWDVPATPSSPVQTQVALGQTVLWRYVSRDGAFVMVRDPRAGGTDGVGLQGWYFLPRGCLPATLP